MLLQLPLLLLMSLTPQTLACRSISTSMYDDDRDGIFDVDTNNTKYWTGCPKYTDIHPVHNRTGKRIAACFWRKKGHTHPLRGCQGRVVCYSDDTHYIRAKRNTRLPIGSVVVLAGCEIGYIPVKSLGFIKWGAKKPESLRGPKVEPGLSYKYWSEVVEIHIFCNKTAAYDCHVNNSNTKFTDRWDTIGIFNNSLSKDKGEFEYTHKIGMAFKDETSRKFFHDSSSSRGGSIEFPSDRGGVDASVSFDTGYDWKRTSTMVRTEKQDVQAKIFVPAGQTLKLQQIIGECPGAFTAHTEVLKAVTVPARSTQP